MEQWMFPILKIINAAQLVQNLGGMRNSTGTLNAPGDNRTGQWPAAG